MLDGAGRRRAHTDTDWCLVVLERCGMVQSTHRHQLLVSGRARTVWNGAEHAQTPIAGVWSCLNGAEWCRARADTNCWCLVMLEQCGMVQSTRRHQLLVSGRAQMVQDGAERTQTPITGV